MGKKRHKLHLDFHQSGAYAIIHSGLPFNNVIVLVNSDTKSLNFGLSLRIIKSASRSILLPLDTCRSYNEDRQYHLPSIASYQNHKTSPSQHSMEYDTFR